MRTTLGLSLSECLRCSLPTDKPDRRRRAPDVRVEFRTIRPEQNVRPLVPTVRRESAPEAARPLHAGADLRVGATLQAAALPVGPGARTFRPRDRSDANAGEDLVSEPPLQDEAGSQGGAEHGNETTGEGRHSRSGRQETAVM